MSDGGSGGKQSPRGCAEYSVMLTKTSLSAHHWTFLYCSKKWFEERYKLGKKRGFFSDNNVFIAEIVLRNKKYRYYERHKRSLIFFAPKIKSGLPLDKNGFMLIQEQRSRIVRFKNQEDKP